MDSTRGSTSTEIFSKVWCLVLWYITVWTDDQRQDSLSRFGFSHTICLLKVELLKDVRIFYRILLSDISRFTLRQGHTWHTWEWLWFGATWLQSKSWRGVNLCCGGRGWSFKKKKRSWWCNGNWNKQGTVLRYMTKHTLICPRCKKTCSRAMPFSSSNIIALSHLLYSILLSNLLYSISLSHVSHVTSLSQLLYIIYVSHFSCIIYTCHCS